MPYVSANGERLFYLRRSPAEPRGPSLLLIHGAGGKAFLWGRVLPHLPAADVIALDLPGHGRSSGAGHAAISAYRTAVLAAADALQPGPLVLVGHSMGGAIALDLAMHEPSRLRGLVLLSVTARPIVAPALLSQLAADPAAARRWLIQAGYGPGLDEAHEPVARQPAQVPPAVLYGDLRACSLYSVRDLAQVRCPALVLCGAEDRLTPPQDVRALAEGLPKARFEIIPHAGHLLPLECPQAVGEAIGRFLAGLGAAM